MLMSKFPLVGNEAMLSKKTLKSRYEAESPDELALVKAVCNYGCRLLSRTNDYVSIFIPTQDKVTFKVRLFIFVWVLVLCYLLVCPRLLSCQVLSKRV